MPPLPGLFGRTAGATRGEPIFRRISFNQACCISLPYGDDCPLAAVVPPSGFSLKFWEPCRHTSSVGGASFQPLLRRYGGGGSISNKAGNAVEPDKFRKAWLVRPAVKSTLDPENNLFVLSLLAFPVVRSSPSR